MANNKTLELSIKIAGKMDKSLMAALNGSQSQISSFARSIFMQLSLFWNWLRSFWDPGDGDWGDHRKLHQGSGEV